MAASQIGPYEILAPLGAGGMGEVFLARDTRLPRNVAIKRVRATGDAGAQRQILREARAVALLSHPNIASLFDIIDHDGELHIVMEYVDGETLAGKLGKGALPPDEAVDYARQIADALAYAHAQGVIHCDVKPSNVMITPDGRARLLDFGIARFEATLRSESEKTTTANVVRGTPPYMAPELLLGGPPSPRSDVYSVGVLLYELLTARRPYEGLDPGRRLDTRTPSPSASDVVPGISRGLSDLVARAISLDPLRRLGSVGELKAALDTVATTSMVERGPGRITFAWRWAAPTVILIAGCAALLSGIPRASTSRPTRDPTVMAVMIFNNSGDEKNDYLGAGLADSLLASLAGSPGITAVSRTAAAPYSRPEQLPKAVRDLGLTHLVTGGVQRADADVRFIISLQQAGGTLLWSGTFDGTVDDIFHLQQRATEATLKALRTRGFVPADIVTQAHARPPTSNAEAFDAYSHARILLDRSDVPTHLDRALALLDRAVQLDARFVRAHAAIGEASWLKYRTTKDRAWVDRARAATIEALRLAPDDPSVRYALAVIEHGTGHPDRAVAELEAVLKAQPASDEAHRLLGRIYSERGELDRAIGEFREALRIRPEYPTTIRALGLAYYDAGRLDDAIALFTRLTELQPDNANAFQNLGTAYHAAGQFDQAIIAYERSNAITPKATSFANVGILYHARGNYPRAIAAYRESIRLAPAVATTHRNLADTLWVTGERAAARSEYQKAIEIANESLKVNAADGKTLALRAFCEAKLGKLDDASRTLAEALRVAPNDNEVVYKEAVIDTLGGRFDAAMTHLQRALQLGFSPKMLAADRDLDPLRKRPDFPVSH